MENWTEQEEAERLRKRFENVKNRAKFASDHHVPGGAAMIYQHITGRRPISLDAAKAYARGFNCPVDEISQRLADDARELLRCSEPDVPYEVRRGRPEKFIWVLGDKDGNLPVFIWEEPDLPADAAREYADLAPDDRAFLVRVRGESMMPRYMPGEFALVEPSRSEEHT